MTELQTIEVRYEDQSGRHVDVHEAAREGRHGDGTFIVSNGLCACCEATEETTSYSEDNIVKVEYGPSEHERRGGVGDTDMAPLGFLVAAAFTGLAIVAIVGFVLTSSGAL